MYPGHTDLASGRRATSIRRKRIAVLHLARQTRRIDGIVVIYLLKKIRRRRETFRWCGGGNMFDDWLKFPEEERGSPTDDDGYVMMV